MGVNYRRLTEREAIHKLVVTKIDESIERGGKYGPISWELRNKNCLCKDDTEKLKILVAYIEEFVETQADQYQKEVDSF